MEVIYELPSLPLFFHAKASLNFTFGAFISVSQGAMPPVPQARDSTCSPGFDVLPQILRAPWGCTCSAGFLVLPQISRAPQHAACSTGLNSAAPRHHRKGGPGRGRPAMRRCAGRVSPILMFDSGARRP